MDRQALLVAAQAFVDDEAASGAAHELDVLLAKCKDALAHEHSPIRTIHHFACSGGTVMSRCIAAQPNAVLLSEIDPLSQIGMGNASRFIPTDLVFHARQARRELSQDSILRVFLAGLRSLRDELDAAGRVLILRDHPHSMFCMKEDPESRPTLHEIIAKEVPVVSVVTTRHPLDSFLGLEAANWRHFDPFTLEEYARRMILFLDRHAGIPIVKYEDFTVDPAATIEKICGYLDMSFNPEAIELNGDFTLSGDSGRKGAVIEPRPRRPVPPEIEAQRNDSPTYRALCERLEYEP